jgi:hypothetical protein
VGRGGSHSGGDHAMHGAMSWVSEPSHQSRPTKRPHWRFRLSPWICASGHSVARHASFWAEGRALASVLARIPPARRPQCRTVKRPGFQAVGPALSLLHFRRREHLHAEWILGSSQPGSCPVARPLSYCQGDHQERRQELGPGSHRRRYDAPVLQVWIGPPGRSSTSWLVSGSSSWTRTSPSCSIIVGRSSQAVSWRILRSTSQ